MEWQNINWIDGVLLALLMLSSILGLFRGLIRGGLGIMALILAIIVAKKYGNSLSGTMSSMFGDSAFSILLGYVLIFIGCMLCFSMLIYLIHRAATLADLGMADKFGGLLFGACRGGAFGLLVVIALSALPLQQTKPWKKSVMLPVFGKVISYTVNNTELREYQKYWDFDAQYRPHLVLSTPKHQRDKGDDKIDEPDIEHIGTEQQLNAHIGEQRKSVDSNAVNHGDDCASIIRSVENIWGKDASGVQDIRNLCKTGAQ